MGDVGTQGGVRRCRGFPRRLPSHCTDEGKGAGGREGGAVGCQICLAQDRKILNPAAFCRLPELWEFCSLDGPAVSFCVSHLRMNVGLRKVKLVPNQYIR